MKHAASSTPSMRAPEEPLLDILVTERVMIARSAQRPWAERSVRDRLAVLRRLRRNIAAAALGGDPHGLTDLAASVQRDSRTETLSAEVLPLVEAVRFLEREAEVLLAPRRPGAAGRPSWLGGVDLEIHREPHGVVLVIGPSNYPLSLPGIQTVQALVAGNAVLLKPGRAGHGAAAALATALAAAGLPEGLLDVLPERSECVRMALEVGVDKVVLTGSADTGREVLRELAPRLVPATMELSGCDAAFVRADADLDRATDALVFGLRLNGGATCIAPRRVFVDSRLAPQLATRLEGAVRSLPPTRVSPEVAGRARRLIEEALRLGARRLSGPLRLDNFRPDNFQADFFPPVVLVDVPREAALLSEDLFAPVLSLVSVSGDGEALALDARCPYALGASVFGAEAGARALARRIRAGVVVVNDMVVPTADPRLPFGGRGASGFGVTRGAEGLLEMTVPKALAVRARKRGRLRHLEPPAPGDESLLRAFVAVGHGNFTTRLRGAVALCRALVRRTREKPSTTPAGSDRAEARGGVRS